MLDIAWKTFSEGVMNLGFNEALMILIGGLLVFLAIRYGFEPLLLIPIGFGAILVNLPMTGLMEPGGLLRIIYDAGIVTELFPCLVFIGIGAMADFTPIFANPRILLLSAAGQFGIFLTVILALMLGFSKVDSCAIGIIGACDGPTAIFFSSQYAPGLLGAISVAAYSYMSLVPIIQPPIMKMLTTKKERMINMGVTKISVRPVVKIIFPIIVTIFVSLIAPKGAPLIGMLMLGNFLRECGVVQRLSNTAQNELANIVTLLLGISIGATMSGDSFVRLSTLKVFALGLVAIVLDTACGIFLGKLMNVLSGGKINPLIGAAGISAFPMSARCVQKVGQQANPQNFLLMHAVSVNTGGQVGSIVAAAIMISLIIKLGLV
ncbi:MAG: sodium ion-translocating decarboxylase subunit beta [Planctomycetota bacterium]